MRKMLFLIAVALIATATTQAQDSTVTAPAHDSTVVAPAPEKPKPVISGSVDVYYRYNFANPKDGSTNNLTSFTNSANSFELGMASNSGSIEVGTVSVTTWARIGPATKEASTSKIKQKVRVRCIPGSLKWSKLRGIY